MTGTTLNYTQIYTTDQAAEVLQINIQTLRKYIREGKLPASKLGSDYRITGEDIKAYLDATKTVKTTLNNKEEVFANMMSNEMKKEINRTGYLYRLEMHDGAIKMESHVTSNQIQYIDKSDVKSIHCVDAVTGYLVDKWEA